MFSISKQRSERYTASQLQRDYDVSKCKLRGPHVRSGGVESRLLLAIDNPGAALDART